MAVSGLRKRFRGRAVVCGISFDVFPGEIVGLLGPNGAGKTTTFRMTVGMLRPDEGTVVLDGEEITDLPLYRRVRLGLGYLAQEATIFRRLSVRENLLVILEQRALSRQERRERCEELLAELDLTRLASSRADRLSGGERRRLEIARALITEPRVLLLDEPFAGVDPLNIADIRSLVAALTGRGLCLLITDHNATELLRTVDRAYVISEGTMLVSGTPQEIVASPVAREAYLGQDFELPPSAARGA